MTLTLTDELSAINLALRAIGESPASSLASLPDDAINAREVIRDVTRRVLTEGWHFNTDEEFPLVASASFPYEITRPATAAKVDVSRTDPACTDVVLRGSRLYDRINHTFSFEGRRLLCDIVWLFEFEELPEALRQYIALRSAREFYHNILQMETTAAGLTQENMQRARSDWEDANLAQADMNLISSNPHLPILRRNTR